MIFSIVTISRLSIAIIYGTAYRLSISLSIKYPIDGLYILVFMMCNVVDSIAISIGMTMVLDIIHNHIVDDIDSICNRH